jgi:hypothetical protein
MTKCCPTKRAPDAGDSGAIPSLFLRLSIFPGGRRSAARPSAGTPRRACGAGRKPLGTLFEKGKGNEIHP